MTAHSEDAAEQRRLEAEARPKFCEACDATDEDGNAFCEGCDCCDECCNCTSSDCDCDVCEERRANRG
jgi:hypothetical protein